MNIHANISKANDNKMQYVGQSISVSQHLQETEFPKKTYR